MNVILGRNAYIEFYKNDAWVPFVCCETVEINITTEYKSVKTIGDGQWDTPRAQRHSYSITGSGIIPTNDESNTNIFDIIGRQVQGVHMEYRMIFNKQDDSEYTMVYGSALVTSTTLTAPVDFVNASFEMKGKGQPTIGIMPTCTKAIVDYTVTRVSISFLYNVSILTLNEGTVPRYDWRLDGGAVESAFDTGWSFSVSSYGAHTLEIWPVCDNDVLGTKTTHNFTTSP